MVIRTVQDQDWIAAIVFLFEHWYFHWDAAMLTLKGKPQQYLPRSSFDTWLVLEVGVFFSSKVFRVLVFSSWKLFSAFFIENFWTLQKDPKVWFWHFFCASGGTFKRPGPSPSADNFCNTREAPLSLSQAIWCKSFRNFCKILPLFITLGHCT